jgi:hypothetical protein
MSENFTVEATTGREEWTGQYGDMLTYKLLVNGGTEIDLNQKPETPAPQIGDQIWGHLEPGKYRQRLKKDQKDGGGGGGKKDDLGPVIHRQVALKILTERICTEGLTPAVKELAIQIETFIGEAGPTQAATSAVNGEIGAQVAAATGATAFDAAGFHGLLEVAGLDSSEASHVVAYVIQEMPPAEQDEALSKLNDPTKRQFVADWLKAQTVAALGNPIPASGVSGDDDIPF